MVYRATAIAVAAPKTKKTAKRSCTILHGVPKTPKSHFSPVIYFLPNGSIALKIRVLKDHDKTDVIPFTAFKNSHWFKSYGLSKIAIFGQELVHLLLLLLPTKS